MKISVTEALVMAGDMTVFGMRNKIKVIRPGINGKLHIHTLNLDHDNVWTSAYFTLKPGDVIYVAPNKAKTDSANIGKKSTLWVSILSSFISIGGLLIKMLKL
jgi:polysaccharide export outer membrane protein